MKVSIELLEAEVLEWAKEHHPDFYTRTVDHRGKPRHYRRFLQGLVEVRFREDKSWDPPLRILEDTRIQSRYRMKDGTVLHVKGRRVPGFRDMSWDLLAKIVEAEFPGKVLAEAIRELDLSVNDATSPWPKAATEPEPEPEPLPMCRKCRKRRVAVEGDRLCATCLMDQKTQQGGMI